MWLLEATNIQNRSTSSKGRNKTVQTNWSRQLIQYWTKSIRIKDKIAFLFLVILISFVRSFVYSRPYVLFFWLFVVFFFPFSKLFEKPKTKKLFSIRDQCDFSFLLEIRKLFLYLISIYIFSFKIFSYKRISNSFSLYFRCKSSRLYPVR